MTVLRETVPKCNGGEPQLQGTALKQHAQEQQCRMALSLALDSKYAEFKVQRVRAMFGSIQKLVSAVLKLLGLIH